MHQARRVPADTLRHVREVIVRVDAVQPEGGQQASHKALSPVLVEIELMGSGAVEPLSISERSLACRQGGSQRGCDNSMV